MWKVDLLEKLKPLLLGRNWQTVSIYKSKDKIYVYIDGRLELEMPAEPEEGIENE